jgi:hypothetical protein
VEFRCPEPGYSGSGRRHPGPLFAVAVLELPVAAGGSVLEYACQRCKQRLARSGHPARRVIHRFALTGALLATLTEDNQSV